MTYQQLTYFYYSAKHASFSKAAMLCYVAQTAVSKQIQNLEDELGCALFARNGRQTELTAAGKNLLVYAERIIALWNDSLTSTKTIGVTNFEEANISVGYWGPIDNTNLANVFNDFRATEPNRCIFYTHLTLSGITRCLMDETVDFIIVPKAHLNGCKGITTCTLSTFKYGIVMSEKHPLAKRGEIDINDFAKDTFIQRKLGASPGLQSTMDQCWDTLDFKPKKLIEANEYKSALMMVSNNSGVMLSPNYVEEIEDNGLVFKLLPGLDMEEAIDIAFLSNVNKPIMKRLVGYLTSKFGSEKHPEQ